MLNRLAAAAVLLLLAGTASRGFAPRPWLYSAARYVPAQSGFTPRQLANAYAYTPLYKEGVTGAGQTVALLEVDSYDPADIHTFDLASGLPDPVVAETFPAGPLFTLDHGAETTMDIEWLHALAPGAAIHVYYLNNVLDQQQGWDQMAAVLRQAGSDGATVISVSLNACGPSTGYASTARALANLRQAGVTVFVSSGDSGAHPGPSSFCGRRLGVGYPAADPSVIAVGGTTLRLRANNHIASETAWHLSGGGRAKRMRRSAWQLAPRIPLDGYRWVPDVAFVADPATGIGMFYNSKWQRVGGTSVGAPAWAAGWALILQRSMREAQGIGSGPALLYGLGNSHQYGRTFHDIVRGRNRHYIAGRGWDALTGLGTPNINQLARAVQIATP